MDNVPYMKLCLLSMVKMAKYSSYTSADGPQKPLYRERCPLFFRAREDIVIPVASSGLASLILYKGRTVVRHIQVSEYHCISRGLNIQ